ncbi:hypothetical protein FHS19_001681 [Paenibacillus rhizosphaerae]|uniref:Uncharacterized protein n=1 Tax=Paenibacillus rhizosphaerae TaxID=297318 RepID=A0A839TQK1_9BACL|nr:hypothetical protein [Paenibacillus rhizosphaerae]MBB3127027.1 hypothetical protein [Paenibacillus rhizosphaerae]
MRKIDWIKVILALSLFVNVFLFMNHKHDNRNQELKYELLNTSIYRDLAQLEVTIQDQKDHNWKNEALVVQKLDDAMDSIIMRIGMERDNDKETLLWKLHDYMKKFVVGDGTFALDISLNDKQRADYIYLGEKLRSSGWSFNRRFDTNWDSFALKLQELVTES